MRAFLAGARIQLRFFRAYPGRADPVLHGADVLDHLPDDLPARRATGPDGVRRDRAGLHRALVARALQLRAGRSRSSAGTARSRCSSPRRRRSPRSSSAGSRRRRWSGVVSFVRDVGRRRACIFGTKVTIHHAWAVPRDGRRDARGDGGNRGRDGEPVRARPERGRRSRTRRAFRSTCSAASSCRFRVLPHWIRPLSSVVFLSWSADLLRAALRPTPMHDFAFRLGMVGVPRGVRPRGRRVVDARDSACASAASGELGTT